MSGFLDGLAARARLSGRVGAAALAPRPRSRFEPEPAGGPDRDPARATVTGQGMRLGDPAGPGAVVGMAGLGEARAAGPAGASVDHPSGIAVTRSSESLGRPLSRPGEIAEARDADAPGALKVDSTPDAGARGALEPGGRSRTVALRPPLRQPGSTPATGPDSTSGRRPGAPPGSSWLPRRAVPSTAASNALGEPVIPGLSALGAPSAPAAATSLDPGAASPAAGGFASRSAAASGRGPAAPGALVPARRLRRADEHPTALRQTATWSSADRAARREPLRAGGQTPSVPDTSDSRAPVSIVIGRIDVTVEPAVPARVRPLPERTRGFEAYGAARRGQPR